MLLGDFYSIESSNRIGQKVICMIRINVAHTFFSCHFPDAPVVPGTCILQILKELLEIMFRIKLCYGRIIQCKFMNPIDPRQSESIYFEITVRKEDEIKVWADACIKSDICSFSQIKSVFLK